MASISEFRSQFQFGGARPNQFRVALNFPTWVANGSQQGQKAQFLCSSASLPGSIVDPITLQYRGRPVHFAGERRFAPWTVRIYNDNDFGIRNAIEVWSHGIQNVSSTDGRISPRDYQVDLNVYQLDRHGATIKTYKFYDAFPIDMSEITLDFEAANQIEAFTTTFEYNYWTSDVAA